MRNSNLAERLELFVAATDSTMVAKSRAPYAVAVADPVRRTPRRLSLTTRRIQSRDPELRQFRVF